MENCKGYTKGIAHHLGCNCGIETKKEDANKKAIDKMLDKERILESKIKDLKAKTQTPKQKYKIRILEQELSIMLHMHNDEILELFRKNKPKGQPGCPVGPKGERKEQIMKISKGRQGPTRISGFKHVAYDMKHQKAPNEFTMIF